MQELKGSEAVIAKYLEYAGDPWVTDFAELRPLMEVHFDHIAQDSVEKLDVWRTRGPEAEVNLVHLAKSTHTVLITLTISNKIIR